MLSNHNMPQQILIHAREGHDAKICDDWFRDHFQSTCPARGTTFYVF